MVVLGEIKVGSVLQVQLTKPFEDGPLVITSLKTFANSNKVHGFNDRNLKRMAWMKFL